MRSFLPVLSAAGVLLVALTACTSSGLGDRQHAVDAEAPFWRTTHETYDIGPWGYVDHAIDVPAGATWLEVTVETPDGGATPTLIGPDEASCTFVDDVDGHFCRIEAPHPGTWMLRVRAEGEGATGIVPSWEVGGADDLPLVLARRSFTRDTFVDVEVPEALGSLEATVTGEGASVSIDDACLHDASGTCRIDFPAAGDHSAYASAQGNGEVTLTWTPAPLLLDTAVGGTRTLPFEVPEGTDQIKVLSMASSHVRLMRGQFELCSGEGSCVVDQPVPGAWSAYVRGTGQDVVRVGAILTTTPTPEPEPAATWMDLVVDEIHADPDTMEGDANCDGFVDPIEDEFIELYNPTGAPVSLDGAEIGDLTAMRHTFAPGTVVGPGDRLVVYGGGAPSCAGVEAVTASTGALGLTNMGDAVVIGDAETSTATSFDSLASHDTSITREVTGDEASAFVRHDFLTGHRFSPGFGP